MSDPTIHTELGNLQKLAFSIEQGESPASAAGEIAARLANLHAKLRGAPRPLPAESTELEGYRRALEIIAVGDSKNPAKDAADALVANGFWTGAPDAAPAGAPPPVKQLRAIWNELDLTKSTSRDPRITDSPVPVPREWFARMAEAIGALVAADERASAAPDAYDENLWRLLVAEADRYHLRFPGESDYDFLQRAISSRPTKEPR